MTLVKTCSCIYYSNLNSVQISCKSIQQLHSYICSKFHLLDLCLQVTCQKWSPTTQCDIHHAMKKNIRAVNA
jgi:hypothetical protein